MPNSVLSHITPSHASISSFAFSIRASSTGSKLLALTISAESAFAAG